MHDIEKLKQANERSLAVAVEENRIAMALPLMPLRVIFGLEAMPWVTYEVKTLPEALDIFKLYEPEPWVIAKDGSCSVLGPEDFINKRYNRKHPAQTSAWRPYETEHCIPDGAPYFDCLQGVGYKGVEMGFFTRAAGVLLKILVKIADCPIRVNLVLVDERSRTPRDRYRKNYPAVPGASIIRWGCGDDCCKGTYWFSDLPTFWASMGTYVPDYALPE